MCECVSVSRFSVASSFVVFWGDCVRLPRPPTHSHFVYEHWQRRMRMLDHPTIVAFRVVVALILELRCALMRVAFRHLRAPSHAISFRARCFATLVGHGLISAGLGGVRELRAELCPASARSAFAPSSQRARGLSMSIVSCPSLTSDSIAFVVESQDSRDCSAFAGGVVG